MSSRRDAARAMISGAIVVLSAALLTGCGGSGAGAGSNTAAPTTRATVPPPPAVNPVYAKRGPNLVSLTSMKTTASRVVEVFYPAAPGSQKDQPFATYDLREALRDPKARPLKPDPTQMVTLPAYRDLPTADGPFPVVLFSHDYGAVPFQSTTLEIDLAAWGFVVIAPDHGERDTLAVASGTADVDDRRDAATLISALKFVAHDGEFGPIMDLDHVAAVGHAQGGATAIAALSHTEIDVAVAWGSQPSKGTAATGAGKPVMLIGAQRDIDDGTAVQKQIYAGITGPKRLVLLGGGTGHATFTDACATLRDSGLLDRGGDVDTGQHLLDLSQNGCFPDEVAPSVAWPVVAHFTIAELRDQFGIDASPVGLGDAIVSAFPKVPLTYEHEP